MLESPPVREEYKFIDKWFGRLRYTIATSYDNGRIAEKYILINGVDGKEAGDMKPLRWYNFIKRLAAFGAVIKKENCPALVDENGDYRIYFGD